MWLVRYGTSAKHSQQQETPTKTQVGTKDEAASIVWREDPGCEDWWVLTAGPAPRLKGPPSGGMKIYWAVSIPDSIDWREVEPT